MIRIPAALLLAAALTGCAAHPRADQVSLGARAEPGSDPTSPAAPVPPTPPAAEGASPMRLGNFSVSLSVKDLAASRAFYEKLGFKKTGGDPAHNYLILQNEAATIGLFQGMFEGNILTFNPGWDRDCKTLPDFDDVRALQQRLRAAGVNLTATADPNSTGPAHLTLTDPDGNNILIDQHVPKPKP